MLQKPGNDKLTFGCVLAVLFIFGAYSPVVLATEIVVNKTVPVADCSTADTRAIFTMQKRAWSNHRQIKVYTLSDNSSLHKEFVKNNLHMFPHQIRRIWDRMTFAGTGSVPIELDSEQEMIDKIANTPDSIGYLSSRPKNDDIRSFEHH
jgi:ABC-type phosphate transport system substrate-binding protein